MTELDFMYIVNGVMGVSLCIIAYRFRVMSRHRPLLGDAVDACELQLVVASYQALASELASQGELSGLGHGQFTRIARSYDFYNTLPPLIEAYRTAHHRRVSEAIRSRENNRTCPE